MIRMHLELQVLYGIHSMKKKKVLYINDKYKLDGRNEETPHKKQQNKQGKDASHYCTLVGGVLSSITRPSRLTG